MLTDLSVNDIWIIVRKIKAQTPLECQWCCMDDGLYSDKKIQLDKLEDAMGIVSSEIRFENITEDALKNAAEMFLYLNTCPTSNAWKKWFSSWSTFFNDLFDTKSPDIILLTLNRMMKLNDNPHYKNEIGILKKIFKRTTTLFSLKYEDIQRMLPGVSTNVSIAEEIPSVKGFDIEGKKVASSK